MRVPVVRVPSLVRGRFRLQAIDFAAALRGASLPSHDRVRQSCSHGASLRELLARRMRAGWGARPGWWGH